MKSHVELRKMAADLRLRELQAAGVRATLQFKMEQLGDGVPRFDCPVILSAEELDRHSRAVALHDPSSGAPAPEMPKPIHDFSAWSYYPSCPKCRHRVIEVDVPDGERPTSDSTARCMRPAVGARSDCGWIGTNSEVERICLGCGEGRSWVEDGECGLCRQFGSDDVFEDVTVLRRRGWVCLPRGSEYQYTVSKSFDVDGKKEERVSSRKVTALEAASLVDLNDALSLLESEAKAELGEWLDSFISPNADVSVDPGGGVS